MTSAASVISNVTSTVQTGHFRITMHAREEMSADEISTFELEAAMSTGMVDLVEDYPEDARGHSHLLLCWIADKPVHVCCAVHESSLVIITVYRPDESRWEQDWRTRK